MDDHRVVHAIQEPIFNREMEMPSDWNISACFVSGLSSALILKFWLISVSNIESSIWQSPSFRNGNEVAEESMAANAANKRMQINTGQIRYTERVYITYQVRWPGD